MIIVESYSKMIQAFIRFYNDVVVEDVINFFTCIESAVVNGRILQVSLIRII